MGVCLPYAEPTQYHIPPWRSRNANIKKLVCLSDWFSRGEGLHIDTYRWQSQALWVFNVCYSLTKSIICLCSLKIRVLILHWISLYTLTLKVINCIRVCIEIYVPHKHTGRLTLLYRTLCLIGTEPADMWATLMALTFIISSSVAQPSTGAKVN